MKFFISSSLPLHLSLSLSRLLDGVHRRLDLESRRAEENQNSVRAGAGQDRQQTTGEIHIYLPCTALPCSAVFSIDSHCDRTDCTVPDPALTDRSSGENKGREHHQAGPRRDQGLESTASRGQVQMITRTTRFLAGMDMYQPLSYGVCSLSQAEVPIGPERHLLPLRCGWRQAQLLRLGRSISCSWTCEKRKTRCCSG